MPASFNSPRFQADDDGGRPLVGGQLFVFLNKTTIPTVTYQDSLGETPNTNPIILDGRGEAVVFVDGAQLYTFVLLDKDGALVWSQDGVSGGGGSGGTVDGGIKQQVLTESGTFTVPNGIYELLVSGAAGGGPGGNGGRKIAGSDAGIGGGGGGGGGAGESAYRRKISVIPGTVIPVTVGAAGTVASGSTVATSGQASVFGPYLTLGGGAAGDSPSSAVPVPGGAGGAGFPKGSSGSDGQKLGNGGAGGSSMFGGGGGGGRAGEGAGIAGAPASGYGAGGGGGGGVYGTASDAIGAGGAGAPGFFSIEWSASGTGGIDLAELAATVQEAQAIADSFGDLNAARTQWEAAVVASAASAVSANTSAGRAETARDSAYGLARMRPTTAQGLIDFAEGEYFSTPANPLGAYAIYRKVSGAAVLIATSPNLAAVQAVLALIRDDFNSDLALTATDREGSQFFRATPTSISTPFATISSKSNEVLLTDSEGGIALRVAPDQTLLGPLDMRYTNSDGVYITDYEGGILATFLGNGVESQLGPLIYKSLDFEGIYVTDRFNGIFRRLDEPDTGADDPEDPDPDAGESTLVQGLLFAPTLAVTPDSPAQINVGSMLYDRNKASTVWATVGSLDSSNVASGNGTLSIGQEFGASAEMFVRPIDTDSILYRLALNIARVPVPAVNPQQFRVLLIGDSIANRQGALFMQQYLTGWNYRPVFVGTVAGSQTGSPSAATGPLGEAREGWKLDEFTYAVTDKPPVLAGEEAAYLAGGKSYRAQRNPFIRLAAGGDDPSIVRNGYVLDFASYASRFGVTPPDIIINALGTNNIFGATNQVELISQNDTLLHSRILAAWPSAKIIRCFPQPGFRDSRNLNWKNQHSGVIKGLIQSAKTIPAVRVAPTWALMNPNAGYEFTAASTDPITGFQLGEISDPTHPGSSARYLYYRALSAYVAAVHLGLA